MLQLLARSTAYHGLGARDVDEKKGTVTGVTVPSIKWFGGFAAEFRPFGVSEQR